MTKKYDEYLDDPELTPEERLAYASYQLTKVYRHWMKDREEAAGQALETAKLVEQFTEQVAEFQNLEPHVRQQLLDCLTRGARDAVRTFSAEIASETFKQVEGSSRRLQSEVERAQLVLRQHENNSLWNTWVMAGVAVISAVIIGFLVARMMVPHLTFSLGERQIADQHMGQLMRHIWPKLTQKEKDHLFALDKQQDSPDVINADENNPDNSSENN